MGHCHCYTQLKTVPDDQWLLFTVQLSNVFLIIQNRHVPGYKQPLVLCTSDGRYPLLQPADLIVQSGIRQPAISFNGEEKKDLEYESFFLGQHSSGSEFCKTSFNWSPDRPYDFMVKATLLLAHRICIGCYDISSDGTLAEWLDVQEWLTKHLGGQWPIPEAILNNPE